MDKIETLISRLEKCVEKLEVNHKPTTSQSNKIDQEILNSYQAAEKSINQAPTDLKEYAIVSLEIINVVSFCFIPQINQAQKPISQELVQFLSLKIISSLTKLHERDPDRKYESYYSGLKDGLQFALFVIIDNDPAEYIKQKKEEFEFYLNKLRLKEERARVLWVESIMAFIGVIQDYIKSTYGSSFSWKKDGPLFKIDGNLGPQNIEPRKVDSSKEETKQEKPINEQLKNKISMKNEEPPKECADGKTVKNGPKTTYTNYCNKAFVYEENETKMNDTLIFIGCTKIQVITKGKLNNVSFSSCNNIEFDVNVNKLSETHLISKRI